MAAAGGLRAIPGADYRGDYSGFRSTPGRVEDHVLAMAGDCTSVRCGPPISTRVHSLSTDIYHR